MKKTFICLVVCTVMGCATRNAPEILIPPTSSGTTAKQQVKAAAASEERSECKVLEERMKEREQRMLLCKEEANSLACLEAKEQNIRDGIFDQEIRKKCLAGIQTILVQPVVPQK